MDQIWWERVPNASAFVNDIVSSLSEEHSIILQYSESLPWQEAFKSFVKETVCQQNASRSFETARDIDEPGPFLLNEFCKREKRSQYRPSKGYAGFFAESDDIVLNERYLWVEVSTEKQLDSWSTFVSDYLKLRDKKKTSAVFILEWQGSTPAPKKKGMTVYSFDDYIGDYDRIVFSMLASSAVKGDTFVKDYLAELASNVIGNDIELYAECFARPKEFLQDPYSVVKDCVENSIRSDGTPFTFSKSREEVNHSIWLAQIRTIYPVIEEFREDFVQKHYSAIKSKLPITTAFDEVYNDPNDVELGTLVYMAGLGLLFLNPKDYEELKAHKDARNTLSHLGILSYEEIRMLMI